MIELSLRREAPPSLTRPKLVALLGLMALAGGCGSGDRAPVVSASSSTMAATNLLADCAHGAPDRTTWRGIAVDPAQFKRAPKNSLLGSPLHYSMIGTHHGARTATIQPQKDQDGKLSVQIVTDRSDVEVLPGPIVDRTLRVEFDGAVIEVSDATSPAAFVQLGLQALRRQGVSVNFGVVVGGYCDPAAMQRQPSATGGM